VVQHDGGDAGDAAQHDEGGDDVDEEESTVHGTLVYLHRTELTSHGVASRRLTPTLPVVYRRTMTDKIRLTQYSTKSG
jgi:hypothetical protein